MSTETDNEHTDPHNILKKIVRIHSLTSRPDLNGKIGTVTTYLPDRFRYLVSITNPDPRAGQSSFIALRGDTLLPATTMDRAKGKITQVQAMARFLMTDPAISHEVRRMYTTLDQRLPSYIKPEYVVLIGLVLFILLIQMIGFHKTFLCFSVVFLVLITTGPDLMAGTNIKTMVRNFPYRLKVTLVQCTGMSWITNRMAMGVFVFILVLTGAVFLAPTPKKGSGISYESTNDVGMYGNVGQKYSMEDIYKMGYDDGNAFSDYGMSLPSSDSYSREPVERDYNDNLDYNSNMNYTPQPKTSNKFGFGIIISMLALGRELHKLAFTPDGKFDMQYFRMNFDRMEIWKKCMMGFLLYRVVNLFL